MLPSTTAPPLPPNFFEISWRILVQDGVARGVRDDPVDVAANGADEGDAHHTGLELGGRGVPLCDREAVEHVELDLLVADGLARPLRKLAPYLDRRQVASAP